MFGKNPIRKQVLREDGALVVQEVFPTLQGEGPFAGRPSIFVRLAGCNLRCWFCDTDFESNAHTHPVAVDALVAQVQSLRATARRSIDLVVITGGEPLRQNIAPFIAKILEDPAMQVQIETAGTLWVEALQTIINFNGSRLHFVCSPKTPKVNPFIEAHCDDYKYIISLDEPVIPETGLPFARTQEHPDAKTGVRPSRFPLFVPTHEDAAIWVQPCDTGTEQQMEFSRRRCAQLAMKYGYRLSLQQHKMVGLP